ncbi:MAG: DNA polymerase III subunit delta [Firmicutes bacterium]|nr:DNA polymerase III subunit delta [Bacillota bacterium]
MDYTEFLAKIKTKMIRGAYIFCGSEIYLADNTLKTLKEAYIPSELEDFNYQLLDAESLGAIEIVEKTEQLPLMNDYRLIIVKNLTDTAMKDMASILDNIFDNPYVVVIFYFCPNTPKKNFNFYKIIASKNSVVEFNPVSDAQMSNWVVKKLKEKNIIIEDDALDLFNLYISFSSDDSSLYKVLNEIEKLISLEKSTIKLDDVKELISKTASANIFNLTDAISSRNTKIALQELEKLFLTREEPIRILYMISRHIILMNKIKNLNLGEYEASKKIPISLYEYRKIKTNINRYDSPSLKYALKKVKEADEIIKSQKNNPQLLLENLVVSIIEGI